MEPHAHSQVATDLNWSNTTSPNVIFNKHKLVQYPTTVIFNNNPLNNFASDTRLLGYTDMTITDALNF
jgi:hypothetical protein